MTTIHQLTWNNHYLGLAVNFASRTKEIINANIGYDVFPLEAYKYELDIHITTARLEELKHLQALKSFNIRRARGDLLPFPSIVKDYDIYPILDYELTNEERLNDLTFKYWLSYIYQQDIHHAYCLPVDSFPEELIDHIECNLDRSMVLTIDYSVANKILTILLSNVADKDNPLTTFINLTVDQMGTPDQARHVIKQSLDQLAKEFFTKDKEASKNSL